MIGSRNIAHPTLSADVLLFILQALKSNHKKFALLTAVHETSWALLFLLDLPIDVCKLAARSNPLVVKHLCIGHGKKTSGALVR